jgi:hypothetical protein
VTWTAAIALLIGVAAALLITTHQHKNSATSTNHPENQQDGERP